MGTKLFVGGLAWETDDARLREVFAEAGEVVEAKVIHDRDTGRSRGFGFVTYETQEEAEAGLEALNGKEVDGRSIRVDWAQEKRR